MDPARWQEIRASFHQVIEMPAGGLEVYFQKLRNKDPKLALEVEKLWQNHIEAGNFMERPASENFQPPLDHIPLSPGSTIGCYHLIRTLGEGGMGTVYLARENNPPNRQVALKVVRQGLATKHMLARFRSEYKTLQRMNHPNIATIFHPGITYDGLPFFAMEYVDGIPITHYCDQKRQTLRARIELYLQAVQATKHAHEKGAIHRDLKPSNVLITEQNGRPMVKIIDFGIVKATEAQPGESLITQSGLILGTLSYMSPEQAGIIKEPIGPYTDVYAMGILLYELTTGVSPFKSDQKTPFHVQLNKIRDMVPCNPSACFGEEKDPALIAQARRATTEQLKDEICGNLDAIIMKAIRKSPDHRYDNMGRFQTDLRRYLEHEPINIENIPLNDDESPKRGYKEIVRSLFKKGGK